MSLLYLVSPIMFRYSLFITSDVINVISPSSIAYSFSPETPKMKEIRQIKNQINSNEAPNKHLIMGNPPNPLPSNWIIFSN